MKIVNMSVDEVAKNALSMAQEGPFIGINIADKQGVVYGNPELVDLNEVDNRGLAKLFVSYGGGAIVFERGDLNIIAVIDGYSDFSKRCLEKIQEFCASKGLKGSEIVGNDLVIKDDNQEMHKVCGIGSVWFGKKTLHLVHTSITINQDLIDKICIKKRLKLPVGLKDYLDVNAEDVLNYLEAHIDEFKYPLMA